jgi:predicted phage gp36 major capsid-like protein
MELTKEQRKFYEETREMARKEIEDIERKIEEELARVKQRLIDLQNAKKASRQIYDGACSRLGVKSDLAETTVDIAKEMSSKALVD